MPVEMWGCAFGHFPIGTTASHRIDVDEAASTRDVMTITAGAIGTATQIGRATPQDTALAVSRSGSISGFAHFGPEQSIVYPALWLVYILVHIEVCRHHVEVACQYDRHPRRQQIGVRGRMTGIRYKDLVRRFPNDRVEELLLVSFPARRS